MKNFLIKNNFYLIAALGIGVGAYTAFQWNTMPVLQRLVGIFFPAIILHVFEESKYPGGFTEMITRKLNFTQKNPHFGEFITGVYILLIVFVPLFFPNVTFLLLAPIIIGILEVTAHLAAIKMFGFKGFYSPGLITAAFVLLPIAIFGIAYSNIHHMVQPIEWLYAFIYVLGSLMLAQQVVVRMSGMKYSDFLKNVRDTLFTKE
jgi:hypothetical protein